MNTRRAITLTALLALVIGACTPAASTAPSTGPTAAPPASPSAAASSSAEASAPAASPSAEVLAPDPAEAVITGIEPGAEITFWTFFLSPTFDQYIKDTIARFEATYPGVTVKQEDHQGTFKDDLNNAFAAGIAPDVINLSVSEGWVSEYADKGLLLGLDTTVPKPVQDIYFPSLWKQQLIDGVNYQFPWYQGLNVELINKAIMEKAGVAVDAFPKTIDGLPALCATILEKAAAQCAIRLTVTDLLAQMVYEGNVKVFTDDGKAFAFNSPEGVAWLQMYVDMDKAGTLDTTVLTGDDRDRPQRLLGRRGPVLRRRARTWPARSRTPTRRCTSNLAMVPSPLGKSGVAGKGLMSISVKKDTKFPNASIALAQFFTNPRSMVQFAKQVAIYPSSPAAYDDPFFSTPPTAIEDCGAVHRQGDRRDVPGHRPDRPQQGRCQRHRPQGRRIGDLRWGRRPGGPRQGRRRREQAPGLGLTGSATRPPGSQPSAGPSRPGRASLCTARTITGPRHDQEVLDHAVHVPAAGPRAARHLRRVPDHRGRLLQLHRLRHRDAAGLGRARQLREAGRGRDVPAGASSTRSSTCWSRRS